MLRAAMLRTMASGWRHNSLNAYARKKRNWGERVIEAV
jgi:hypothetical protein